MGAPRTDQPVGLIDAIPTFHIAALVSQSKVPEIVAPAGRLGHDVVNVPRLVETGQRQSADLAVVAVPVSQLGADLDPLLVRELSPDMFTVVAPSPARSTRSQDP